MPKTAKRSLISEAVGLTSALVGSDAPSGRLQIGLITPGWGSSGYYSPQVLEAAATSKIFPAGTQMFLDHPSESEQHDRPERSVRDIAAILTEDATWDGQRLVAEAQAVGPYVEMLTDEALVASIGVSIRAYADATIGEAEGRKGRLITELVEGISVDFVTRAGRGGSILAVLESARPSRVVERAITAGVAEATANDTRAALSQALRAAYGEQETFVWVRDFDERSVWFELESPDAEGTFQQSYTMSDAGVATLDGDPVEVRARTEYVPVAPTESATNVPAPAGRPTTTPIQEDHMGTIQVDEAQYASVTEAAGRVPTLESERDQALQRAMTAERERDIATAREAARPIVAAAIAESSITPRRKSRIVEAILAKVTLDTAGNVNADALVEAAKAEVAEAEADMAELAEALGAGKPRGFGATQSTDTPAVSEADVTAAVARAFGRKVQEA